MKWYTLEERPIQLDDWGVFYVQRKGDIKRFKEGVIKGSWDNIANEGELYLRTRGLMDPTGEGIFEIKDILYWIPVEELKATLPKE